MLDQLFGLVLLGLGLQSPLTPSSVLGDDTQEVSEQTESDIPSNVSPERRELYKKEIEKRKNALEAKRKETEAEYKEKRTALKAQFADVKDIYRAEKRNVEEFRAHSEEEREAYVESLKARIEQAKVERETRLEDFKAKVEAFKDEKKKQKVEDIQSRISAFVAKRIEIMTSHITKMNDLVVLNQAQVTQKAGDNDTAAFDAAATTALTAINTAKDSILALSSTQYVVTVTSEGTVKSDVQKVKNTIQKDLDATQLLLKNARLAVSTMIQERAKLLGEPIPEAVIK